MGDRCAQLLVAVLIIITTLQTDIGLGNLSYLIWVDWPAPGVYTAGPLLSLLPHHRPHTQAARAWGERGHASCPQPLTRPRSWHVRPLTRPTWLPPSRHVQDSAPTACAAESNLMQLRILM